MCQAVPWPVSPAPPSGSTPERKRGSRETGGPDEQPSCSGRATLVFRTSPVLTSEPCSPDERASWSRRPSLTVRTSYSRCPNELPSPSGRASLAFQVLQLGAKLCEGGGFPCLSLSSNFSQTGVRPTHSPMLKQQRPQHIGTVLGTDLVGDDHLFHHLMGHPRQRLLIQVEKDCTFRGEEGDRERALLSSRTCSQRCYSWFPGREGPMSRAAVGRPLAARVSYSWSLRPSGLDVEPIQRPSDQSPASVSLNWQQCSRSV